MNPWETLELQPNSSLKEIKKAYAKLLKINHPEDNPEGYQKLRKAYDMAVKLSKTNENKSSTDFLVNTDELDNRLNSSDSEDKQNAFETLKDNSNYKIFNDDSSFTNTQDNYQSNYKVFNNDSSFSNTQDNHQSNYRVFNDDSNFNNSQDSHQSNYKVFNNYFDGNSLREEELDNFFSKLDMIYSNPKLRFKEESWQELFNNPIVWNLEYTETLFTEISKYLSNHFYITKKIWDIINKTFFYTEKLNNYKFDDSQYNTISNLIDTIDNLSNISFDYLDTIDPLLLDEYLYYKYNAYHNLNIKFYGKAKEYLDSAFNLYKYDPELYKMQGNYYFELRNAKEALTYYNKAVDLNNNNYESICRIGQIYCYYKEYSKAIPYLDKAPLLEEFTEALVLLGHCYYYTNEFTKAYDCYERFMELAPNHSYLKKYISNIKMNKLLPFKVKLKDLFNYIKPMGFLNTTFYKEKPAKKIKINKFAVLMILGIILRSAKVYVKYQSSNNHNNVNQNTIMEQQRESLSKVNSDTLDKFKKQKEELNALSSDYKAAQVNSDIKLGISNYLKLPFFTVIDDSGKLIYLTESEFNSSMYKDNKGKYDVKRFYFYKTDSNTVVIFTSEDFIERLINGSEIHYIKCNVKALSPELSAKIQNELKKSFANENVTLISDKYFENVKYYIGI